MVAGLAIELEPVLLEDSNQNPVINRSQSRHLTEPHGHSVQRDEFRRMPGDPFSPVAGFLEDFVERPKIAARFGSRRSDIRRSGSSNF
ncbi:MAG TPA: hypothetical protein VMN76_04630 [Acidobacteriota bacterium]|nr:hypothetical protein [Acidobacteriota bacterium]